MVSKPFPPPNGFNKISIVWKPSILITSEPLDTITGDRQHGVLTQKTFTKWANVQLNGAHIINDVEKDLDDGLVLIALFEALRKQEVNFKRNKNPKMRVARLETRRTRRRPRCSSRSTRRSLRTWSRTSSQMGTAATRCAS